MPLTILQARNKKLLLLTSLAVALKKKKPKKRYIRDVFSKRIINGEFFLLPDLENDELYHKKYFRMSKESFDELFKVLEPDLTHSITHAYPICAKLRLAVTLRYLATGSSQIQLAMSYRISPSSVGNILRETMSAVIKHLQPVHLPKPSHETWIESEKTFREKWNFPFCLGAIDGKHVRLRCPFKSGSTHYNYKGFFSQVVLAVAGGDYRFLVADIGTPGSESDAAIFGSTSFARSVVRKKLKIPENGKLGQNKIEVPYVFVGDEAFPLKPWLMRPFPGKELDMNRRIFNFRLSRARRIVENAFGIWASRWRIFFTPIDGDADLVHMIIMSTMILHNYLRSIADKEITEDIVSENGVIQGGNWREDIGECAGLQPIPRVGTNNYSMEAFTVREIFVNYFRSEEGSLQGQEAYVMRS